MVQPSGSMKHAKLSETKIVATLTRGDTDVPIAELCHQTDISTATHTGGSEITGAWTRRLRERVNWTPSDRQQERSSFPQA